MAEGPDLNALRTLIGRVTEDMAGAGTHRDLSARLAQVGLATTGEDGSKAERARYAVAATADAQMVDIARQVLAHVHLDSATRNVLQDTLWSADTAPEISLRVRREIARDLDLEEFLPAYGRFKALLDQVWVLDAGRELALWTGQDRSLGAEIDRHVARNPGDWTAEQLFDYLGAFEATDKRFGLFLEGIVSGEVLVDEPAQRRLATSVNASLASAGLVLREEGEAGGYPVFRLVSTRAHAGRPKNLIFASDRKPDLRLISAIDNDIEIATGADQVLVYDRPITREGLRWRDLQAWWKDTQGLDDDEVAKRSLWDRLRRSLPDTSPPQRLLFDLYHRIYGERIHDLPALLPEVWLHWDPHTIKARGAIALPNLRMDFLMLLPGGHRVVLEVDGRHHYATGERADPAVYAATMRADRELKLARYDVYRFGTADLAQEQPAREMLTAFFADLFNAYRSA